MSEFKVTKESYLNDSSFDTNHLHIRLKGKGVNNIIVNTIRRVILDDIPTYAFNIKNIDITANTSVYNNDYLRNRIENLPVQKIKPKFDLELYEKLRKFARKISTFEDTEIEKNIESNINLLNFYLKYNNNDEVVKSLTSDDINFYNNGVKIDSIYDNPVLICKLKKGEKIELSAIVDIGIGLNHASFSPVFNCYYKMFDDNDYLLKIEPKGQLTVKEILDQACKIIIFRLKNILEKFNKKSINNNSQSKLIIKNEDHTIGNLLSKELQEHKNIDFASYKLDHALVREVTIDYVTNGAKAFNIILKECINNIIKKFENLNIIFNKIKL